MLQLLHNKTQPRNTNKCIFLFWYSRVILLWPSISTQTQCIGYSKGVQFNWYHSDCNNHITTSWVNTCWDICHHIVKAMWSCGGMRPRWTNAGTPIFAAKVNAQITLEKTNRDEKKIYWKSQVAVQVEKVTYLLDFFPVQYWTTRFQLQTVCCNKVTQAFHAQTKHSFLEAYQRGKDLKCNIAALSCFLLP